MLRTMHEAIAGKFSNSVLASLLISHTSTRTPIRVRRLLSTGHGLVLSSPRRLQQATPAHRIVTHPGVEAPQPEPNRADSADRG